ncbi:MAG: hypothetical protein PUF22_02005, partial [Clostridium sp.]|nr:hypothetical protein [Clostridium sp.]
HTFLAPYGEVENKINEFYDKDIWMWQCEQTKEIRFMPSLARDNMKLAFIMNLSNEFGKPLVKNDIFNLSFDKNALEGFISSEFIDKFIYADRDDFTTNRESAIIFGIPSCFIEGLLVGRRYEHDNEQLKLLKKYFPNCYICNLDGVVINI